MDTKKLRITKMEPFQPPHEVDKWGHPTDPKMRQLQFILGNLAAEWRGQARGDSDDKQAEIVEEYHSIMNQLYEMEWDAILDIVAELPDELMPEEYILRHPPVTSSWNVDYD